MGNLASAVDELAAIAAAELPDAAVGELVLELRQHINRLEGAYLRFLENFDRRGGAHADHVTTASWLGAQTNMSPSHASRDVHLARDLADLFPATASALADGDISPVHAQVIASVKSAVTPDTARTVDPHLAEAARTHTPVQLRGWVTYVKETYSPEKAAAADRDDYEARAFHVLTTIAPRLSDARMRWSLSPSSRCDVVSFQSPDRSSRR